MFIARPFGRLHGFNQSSEDVTACEKVRCCAKSEVDGWPVPLSCALPGDGAAAGPCSSAWFNSASHCGTSFGLAATSFSTAAVSSAAASAVGWRGEATRRRALGLLAVASRLLGFKLRLGEGGGCGRAKMTAAAAVALLLLLFRPNEYGCCGGGGVDVAEFGPLAAGVRNGLVGAVAFSVVLLLFTLLTLVLPRAAAEAGARVAWATARREVTATGFASAL